MSYGTIGIHRLNGNNTVPIPDRRNVRVWILLGAIYVFVSFIDFEMWFAQLFLFSLETPKTI